MDLSAVKCKLAMCYKSIEDAKQAKSIKRIMEFKEEPVYKQAICKATNMNGNGCKSKATCGKYCKRHKI